MGIFAQRLHIRPWEWDMLGYHEFLTLKSYIDRMIDDERQESAKLNAKLA